MEVLLGISVWIAVIVGARLGSRGLDRAFRLMGDYSAGPRPYPDQDPAPHESVKLIRP